MTAMPALQTDRLIVRPFAMADLEAVSRVLNEAWGEHLEPGEREPWLRWTVAGYAALAALKQPPYGDRAVEVRATGELAGAVGLVPAYAPFGRLPSFGGNVEERWNRPELGLYWAVAPQHQGKGYATEAARAIIAHVFGAMAARAIVATTTYGNGASIAVMRRLGMSIEGNPLRDPPWFQVCGVLVNPAVGGA